MSGTSMSAPMVTGAIALLLERRPSLTPNQLKQLLVGSARLYPAQADRAGELNVVAALAAATPSASQSSASLPISGTPPPTGQVRLLWDGSRWATTYWDGAHWDANYWDAAHWDADYWDGAHWDGAHWDGAQWDGAPWDGAHWDGATWDGAHWDGAHWDGAHWDNSAYD
jgi:serine protease AprX